MKRYFGPPEKLEERLRAVLKSRWNLSLDSEADIRNLAKDVLRMSDYYIANPLGKTPWDEDWCQRAQLVYFLPLNATRMRAVMAEAAKLGFFTGLKSGADFGAGLGATNFALSAFEEIPFHLTEIEISSTARRLRSELAGDSSLRHIEETQSHSGLLVCSYSLTEFQKTPDLLQKHSDLILVEPGTREDGRRLLKLRQALLEQGFSIWAPCTHQGACPLLEQSQTDWCHDRILFSAPSWFEALEKHLPIKNPSLVFSYLIASKRQSPVIPGQSARLTGDALKEKGKTRQLFCRGPQREFLSWLERYGEASEWPRGLRVEVPEGESKGQELRLRNPLKAL